MDGLCLDFAPGRIVCQLGGGTQQLITDAGLLRIALRNRLANADRHTPEAVEQLRREGASYFVAYEERLLRARPKLEAYLESHAEQIGEGIESGCAIYRLRPGDPISLAAP